jgi:paraquat-inducible protein A
LTHSSSHSPPDIVGCSDCGLVQILPLAAADNVVECARCGLGLAEPSRAGLDAPLAFSAAALLLLPPAFLSPLMSLTSFGVQRRNWLPTGVEAMWAEGFAPLATVVFLFSILIPLTYLGLLVYVLGGIRLGVTASLGKVFRWAEQLRPWAMIEVYLVGCCVAYTRLQDVGDVQIDIGGWCLIGAAFAAQLAALTLDERSVWDALPFQSQSPRSQRAILVNTISCAVCDLLLDAQRERSICPRCAARLHRRKPDTLSRTLALVITGFLLYVPANLLPVLSIERFGRVQPNTILSGVQELISLGLWPLAALVFTASIVVPLMKLLGLSMMLLMTSRRSRHWLVARTRLYRFVDFIGRWSSIDLFMISILVALVQFGELTRVRPQGGAMAFAAVVVVTMIASRCFDPRVMWDVADGST